MQTRRNRLIAIASGLALIAIGTLVGSMSALAHVGEHDWVDGWYTYPVLTHQEGDFTRLEGYEYTIYQWMYDWTNAESTQDPDGGDIINETEWLEPTYLNDPTDEWWGPVQIYSDQNGGSSNVPDFSLLCTNHLTQGQEVSVSWDKEYTNLSVGVSVNNNFYLYFGSDCSAPGYTTNWDTYVLQWWP